MGLYRVVTYGVSAWFYCVSRGRLPFLSGSAGSYRVHSRLTGVRVPLLRV